MDRMNSKNKRMTILVIKHVDCEGLGVWKEFCRDEGIAIEVVALHRGDPLPPPHQYQGVISLGGPMNVYEEGAYPFLKMEDRFIRQALCEDVPFLGICLGGQLLAKAVGGLVMRNDGKEIGWHPITLDQMAQRDPLLAGLPERFTVFQWHGDSFHPPIGAVQLASSQACRNQAFRFGGIAYAFQFHLEVTPLMIGEWSGEYGAELAAVRDLVNPAQMLGETPAQCEKLRPLSRQVFNNFRCLICLRASRRGSPTTDWLRQGNQTGSGEDPKVDRAWQRYRELMSRGQLRCGVTCPVWHIGHCTGGCW
ncbi:MAG: type 1 glutamine amidotransferase [Candidatus Methylomirabilales bacterium]